MKISSKPLVLILGTFGSLLIFAGCALQKNTQVAPQTQSTQTTPSTADIRQLIDTGAAAREKGDYQTGETKLAQAFEEAIALKDKALTIEAGNNLSIQYRLSAGRANRMGKFVDAQTYSKKSIAVYQKLKDLGWFDDKDPNIARNWAHALLYAGEIDQAVPALRASLALQTNPAAQGDESDHLAAAAIAQKRMNDAKNLNTKGLNLIQKNNGSKVWLTFGLEVRATWLAKSNQLVAAKTTLYQALEIAKQNNLTVRQEEISYMLQKPINTIDVLQTVGTLELLQIDRYSQN